MCSECRQTPCHPRCPNAPEPIAFGYCEQCGKGLRGDYEYFTDSYGNTFCSLECALDYYGIKSSEWNVI